MSETVRAKDFTIRIDDSRVRKLFHHLKRRGANLEPVMDSVSQDLVDILANNIRRQGGTKQMSTSQFPQLSDMTLHMREMEGMEEGEFQKSLLGLIPHIESSHSKTTAAAGWGGAWGQIAEWNLLGWDQDITEKQRWFFGAYEIWMKVGTRLQNPGRDIVGDVTKQGAAKPLKTISEYILKNVRYREK